MGFPLRTGVEAVDKALDRVWSELDRFRNAVTSDFLIKDVTIGTSDTTVTHKLGRPPIGVIAIKQNASASIYLSTTVATDPRSQLILKASASVKATLLLI